jgi:hypothetical protein
MSWSIDDDYGSDAARTVTDPSEADAPYSSAKSTDPQGPTKSTHTSKKHDKSPAEKFPATSASTKSTGVHRADPPVQTEGLPAPCPPQAVVNKPKAIVNKPQAVVNKPKAVVNTGASEEAVRARGAQQDPGKSRQSAGQQTTSHHTDY